MLSVRNPKKNSRDRWSMKPESVRTCSNLSASQYFTALSLPAGQTLHLLTELTRSRNSTSRLHHVADVHSIDGKVCTFTVSSRTNCSRSAPGPADHPIQVPRNSC